MLYLAGDMQVKMKNELWYQKNDTWEVVAFKTY